MSENEPQNELPLNTPTPQEKIKEAQKQEAALEGMKTRCKVCFRETSPRRQCGGHGGGGGGPSGGGGSSSDSTSGGATEEKKGSGKEQSPSTDTSSSMLNEAFDESDGIDEDSDLQVDEDSFNPEVIADLLEKNLLSIDNDRDLETLTIKLLCKPEELTEEQKEEFTKFVNAIVKQLDDFKEEKGISQNCKIIERDTKGNILSLRIALPNTKLYDAFIQRLAANLLPEPNLNKEQQAKAGYQNNINPLNPTPLSPTPLATKPAPSAIKKVKSALDKVKHDEKQELKLKLDTKKETKDEEEEENEDSEKPFNPSPFSTILKPRD